VRSGTKCHDPLDFLPASDRGLSLSQVFRRIEEPESWVALYNVQSDPEYRKMIWQVLESVGPQLEQQDRGVFDADGFIFISSPPSATPFHFDRENNFFLQIHGRKRTTVWHPDNRDVVPEEIIEQKIGLGTSSKAQYADSFLGTAAVNAELGPGEGIYMPSTSAHMTNTESIPVNKDDAYSVSIGIVYYTKATRRSAYVYALNGYLRKFGLRPRPPYESRARDAIKFPLALGFVQAKRALARFVLPPGM
jgi:hypothetical protein